MAFSKKRVEDRKRWLSSFVPGTYLDQSVDTISYNDFVHKVRGVCEACPSWLAKPCSSLCGGYSLASWAHETPVLNIPT